MSGRELEWLESGLGMWSTMGWSVVAARESFDGI
jgi:hypothetical protein